MSGGPSNANLTSLSYRIGLGRWTDEQTAGALRIKSDEWDAALNSRATLEFRLAHGLTATAITGGDQIDTNFAEVQIIDKTTSPTGYTVTFRRKDGITVQTNPFARFTVTSPASQTLRIERETIDESTGNTTRREASEYEYLSVPVTGTDRTWVLTQYGDNGSQVASEVLSVARLSETDLTVSPDGFDGVEELREYLDGSTVVRSETRVYRDFDGESEIVEWTRDTPGSGKWKRSWAYHDKEEVAELLGYASVAAAETAGEVLMDDPRYGEMLSYVSEAGYWEHYEYDDEGKKTRTIMPLGDEVYTEPSDLADTSSLADDNVQVVVESNPQMDLERAGYLTADVIKTQVIEGLGSGSYAVRQTRYEIDWSNPKTTVSTDYTESWEVTCAVEDPLASATYSTDTAFLVALVSDYEANETFEADSVAHLVEREFRFGSWFVDPDTTTPGKNEPFQLAQVVHSDGTVTLYDRPNADDQVITRGEPDDTVWDVDTFSRAAGLIKHGTRTTREYGDGAEAVATYVERKDDGGSWFAESLTKTTDTDAFARPLETSYWFGADASAEWGTPTGLGEAYTTSQTYGCCGADSRTDRYGLVTNYLYDDLGRMICTTRPDGVSLHYTHDASGRVVKVEREAASSGAHGSGTKTVDATSGYDLAGRMASGSDAGGADTYYTYRTVTTSGGAYTVGTSTGPFYWETRVYPHDTSSGPVGVTWTDSHGRTARSWTASTAATWSDSSPPDGTESLTELSRTTYAYDWAGRVTEARSYHDVTGLGIANAGTEGTNYYELAGGVYDALGRMVKSEDALGNITVTTYGAPGSVEDGRVLQTWAGTDDGSPTDPEDYHTPGSLTGDLEQVGESGYDAYGELDESRRLKAKSSLTSFATDSVGVDYEDDYTVTSGGLATRVSWSKPADGPSGGSPWTKQTYDEQGRMTLSQTYNNGGTTLLTQSEQLYDDTSGGKGRLQYSRVYEVSSGTAGDYLETEYFYDDAGRQFKTTTPGSGSTVTLYDDVGRVKASLVVSTEGTDTDPAVLTDDVVASETVYFYDAADRVTITVSLSRKHDVASTVKGRLWDESAEKPEEDVSNDPIADVRYVYTIYDATGRVLHVADYGDSPYVASP